MADKKPSVFVFDADDTLWMLGWLYDKAYLECFLFLNKTFSFMSPCLHSVYKTFFENEIKLSETWGIKRGRVAESMVELYKKTCDFAMLKFSRSMYDPEHEALIREIGDIPFDYRKLEWLHSARITLAYLKSQGHRLCLLSSYDKKVFPKKAEFLNIKEFFEEKNILVTEVRKTREDFIKVSGWNLEAEGDFDKWVASGNGESDIDPAVGISQMWHGRYIPHMTTSPFFEKATSDFIPPAMKHERVITFGSIIEILDHI